MSFWDIIGRGKKPEGAVSRIDTDGYDYNIEPDEELDSKGYFKIGKDAEWLKRNDYVVCEYYHYYLLSENEKRKKGCVAIIIGKSALNILKLIAARGMVSNAKHVFWLFKMLLKEEMQIIPSKEKFSFEKWSDIEVLDADKSKHATHFTYRDDPDGRLQIEMYWEHKEKRIQCTYHVNKKADVILEGKNALKLLKGIAITKKRHSKEPLITSPSYLVHIAEELWHKQKLMKPIRVNELP